MKFYKKIEDKLTHQKLNVSNLRYEVDEIVSEISRLKERTKHLNLQSGVEVKKVNEEVLPKKNREERNKRIRFKPFVIEVDLTETDLQPLFELS